MMLKQTHRLSAMASTGFLLQSHVFNPFLTEASITKEGFPDQIRTVAVLTAMLVGAWYGSTLPDDAERWLSLKHRHVTHSIYFIGAFFLLGNIVFRAGLGTQYVAPWIHAYHKIAGASIIGIAIGAFWHVFYDAFSVQSVDPLLIFGYKSVTDKDGKTVRVANTPIRVRLYRTGEPFLGMTPIVWKVLLVIALIGLYAGAMGRVLD